MFIPFPSPQTLQLSHLSEAPSPPDIQLPFLNGIEHRLGKLRLAMTWNSGDIVD
jgi:hypothetical protein